MAPGTEHGRVGDHSQLMPDIVSRGVDGLAICRKRQDISISVAVSSGHVGSMEG